MATCRLYVRVAWWWKYYAGGVVLLARLLELEPAPSKVLYWARRAITVTVVPDDGQG